MALLQRSSWGVEVQAAANRQYARGLSRGFGGALLFAFPLLMTMEMWQLGFSMERGRLLILLLVSLPMLLGLSYFSGFEQTFRLKDEILDALAALAIGILLATAMLAIFGVLGADHPLSENVGKITLCAIPGAMGALLAGKQLGGEAALAARPKADGGYLGELFTMMVGGLFLAFNVAPTEEIVLIAYQMTELHTLALMALSIGLLHVIVYELGFPGEDLRRQTRGLRRTLLSFTVPGYGLALLISLYCLWTFGRLDGISLHEATAMTVVMAFPAALGCATARLVI
jgi:putative integral membrane protein (TIGR02587 family)